MRPPVAHSTELAEAKRGPSDRPCPPSRRVPSRADRQALFDRAGPTPDPHHRRPPQRLKQFRGYPDLAKGTTVKSICDWSSGPKRPGPASEARMTRSSFPPSMSRSTSSRCDAHHGGDEPPKSATLEHPIGQQASQACTRRLPRRGASPQLPQRKMLETLPNTALRVAVISPWRAMAAGILWANPREDCSSGRPTSSSPTTALMAQICAFMVGNSGSAWFPREPFTKIRQDHQARRQLPDGEQITRESRNCARPESPQ